MPPRLDTISFLSDYGTSDEFVGVVKSVIRSIAPHVAVVDITHDIRPYDVKGGAYTLARSVQYLCPGVVLAVVDPGVGTGRRAVAIEVGHGESYLVGPDNGLLASAVGLVGGATGAVELTATEYHLAAPGPTFAGRDVFAPAAAHLCAGVPLDALGRRVDPAELVPGLVPLPREEGGAIVGEVLWVDRYGNCQVNVDPDEIAAWGDRVQLRWTRPQPGVRTARRAGAYDALEPGQVGLVVDSYGLLAVSVSRGSAAELLGLVAGDELTLVPLVGDDEPDATAPGDGNGVTSPVTLHRKPR
ncbi:MAG TPA: SAM-dependent chlorinase/fluorinase [Acidimicrobiales bacterium]|nr:SAM-dependent chlorinase/fluorinase [Acidimicrobiales bacterium]